jgi:hypothetical protein
MKALCSFNQDIFFHFEQPETNSEMLNSALNNTVLPVMHHFVHSCPLRYHTFSKLLAKKACHLLHAKKIKNIGHFAGMES